MKEDLNVRVRPMVQDDLEPVERIDRISFTNPWPPGAYQHEIARNPLARCWVAEIEHGVIGVLVGWLVLDEYQIATLAVDPDYRRRGVGKVLLRKAIDEAEGEGAVKFTLEVRAGNSAAQALYRSFGFRIVGVIKARYSGGEDAVLMEGKR